MFRKGDYVFYASGGVCHVEDLRYAPIEGMPADRLYYVLRSLHDANGVIYLPTDCTTVFMRRLLTRREAEDLIRSVPAIQPLEAEDAKALRAKYTETMKKYDPTEWVRVIKTVLQRKRRLAETSRSQRLSETERSFADDAKRYLYTELSFALDLPADQVEKRLFGDLTEVNG